MSEIQGKPVYGICECKEKRQVLSVDQVTDLIQQMAANNWQVPADYIPKTSINGIIEQNAGRELKLWLGTQSQWDAFTGDKNNVFAIITDDPTLATINKILNEHGQSIENINKRINTFSEDIKNGTITVGNTTKVQGVDLSADTSATFGDYVVTKRKLIWTGDLLLGGSTIEESIEEILKDGDVLEVELGQSGDTSSAYYLYRHRCTSRIHSSNAYFHYFRVWSDVGMYAGSLNINTNTQNVLKLGIPKTMSLLTTNNEISASNGYCKIFNIWKIIE